MLPKVVKDVIYPKKEYEKTYDSKYVGLNEEEIKAESDCISNCRRNPIREAIENGKRMICLQVNCGTGKTEAIVQDLKKHLHCYSSILVVSNGRSQVKATSGILKKELCDDESNAETLTLKLRDELKVDFHTYNEKDLDITKCRYLVIEYESLHRLGAFTKSFD